MFLSDLNELTDGLRAVVRNFEPETMLGGQAAKRPSGQAAKAVDRFAELERLAAAGKLLAAARVDACGTWKNSGHRTAASWLASRSGTGNGAAADGLTIVARLGECPGTDKALRAGELSVAQANEITRGAVEAPEAEDDLLDLARREDLRTLQQESLRLRHRGKDAEAKHRRQHARRRTHTFSDAEGMAAVDSRFTPEIGALAWAALDHYTNIEYRRAKAEGRREDLAAYRADAMAAIFALALAAAGMKPPASAQTESPSPTAAPHSPSDKFQPPTSALVSDTASDLEGRDDASSPIEPDVHAPSSAPPTDRSDTDTDTDAARTNAAQRPLGFDAPADPFAGLGDLGSAFDPTVALAGSGRWAATKIIVRVDHSALNRGWTEGDEICEIVGLGPIPVSVVEQMMAGDAFLTALVTKGQDVLSVAHLGRKRTAYQRTALEWLYPTCTVEGCSNPRIQIDHRLDYARTRHTKVDECDALCEHHHGLKTFQNWALAEGKGKRPMVPPDHLQHPKNKKNATKQTRTRERAGKPVAQSA